MSNGAAIPTPPREVRWAGLALWVVATLYAVSALLTLFTRDARADALRLSDTTLTDSKIEQSVTLGVTISLAFGLAIAAIAIVSAIYAPKGRRWARVSGTVVASIVEAFALLRLFAGGPTAAVNLVVLIASLATVVLLYRRPTAVFFARADPRAL